MTLSNFEIPPRSINVERRGQLAVVVVEIRRMILILEGQDSDVSVLCVRVSPRVN